MDLFAIHNLFQLSPLLNLLPVFLWSCLVSYFLHSVSILELLSLLKDIVTGQNSGLIDFSLSTLQ